MRGNRFPALTWETMTPAQVQMTEQVLAGKRGSMQGPYNVLLRSPELGNLAQQFGAHTRFHSSLPLALNELAILLVAHFWQSPFVWWAHKAIALEAGLDAALVDAIAASQAPSGLEKSGLEATKAVYDFCNELLQNRRASDAAFANMKTHFGEQGIVDTMGTISYYSLVSMCLNVDQYPMPA
jgi:4-carboxymuconolactone decarboxylase